MVIRDQTEGNAVTANGHRIPVLDTGHHDLRALALRCQWQINVFHALLSTSCAPVSIEVRVPSALTTGSSPVRTQRELEGITKVFGTPDLNPRRGP